jgi:hypothetical protein
VRGRAERLAWLSQTRPVAWNLMAAEVVARWGVTGLRVAVQSARAPAAVHARIEAFLVGFRAVLEEMGDETYAEYVDSLIEDTFICTFFIY